MSKEAALEIIAGMPEDFSLDELVKRLRINDMVNEGIEDYKAGNYYTADEMRDEIEKIKSHYRKNAA